MLDQDDPATTGWTPLGEVDLEAGQSVTVTLEASATGAPAYADAVLLLLDRKRTPALVISPLATPVEPGHRPDAAVGPALRGPDPNPSQSVNEFAGLRRCRCICGAERRLKSGVLEKLPGNTTPTLYVPQSLQR